MGKFLNTLHCSDCAEQSQENGISSAFRFIPNATIKIESRRYQALWADCISKMPSNGSPIIFPTSIRDRKRGSLPGVVGLTKFSLKGYSSEGDRVKGQAQHTITFYTSLLDRLSDKAVVAVMAHELAHAWLNENIRPEASKVREQDADMLAEMWGFENELKALASETDPL